MTEDLASAYRRNLRRYQDAATAAENLLTSLLNDERVNHLSVQGSAKDEDSFVKKAQKINEEGRPKYSNPLDQIQDMVGLRVITYLTADVDRVLEIVRAHFDVLENTDKGALTAARGEYGYSSHHLLVRLNGPRAQQAEYASLRGLVVEIQVRTTLQHAWAEFEHDVRYKAEITGAPQAEINRRFTLAAGLLELADNEFTRIDALTRAVDGSIEVSYPAGQVPGPDAEDQPVHGQSVALYVGGRYPGAPRSKQEHYDWIASLLLNVPLRTISELDAVLGPEPRWDVARGPSAVRALDDELLARLGDGWIDANRGAGPDRVRALTRRLAARG